VTSEGFWIDPGEVRTTAPAFNGLGDRLSDIFAGLSGKLAAEGCCWGGDEYGKAFEKSYDEPKNNAFEFLPQLAKGLRDIGTGLVETADTVDRGEGTNQQMFQT
jgi:uncharacterized protein YukE